MYEFVDFESVSKKVKFNMIRNLVNESMVNLNQAVLFMEYLTKNSSNSHLYTTVLEHLKDSIRKDNHFFQETLKNIIDEMG